MRRIVLAAAGLAVFAVPALAQDSDAPPTAQPTPAPAGETADTIVVIGSPLELSLFDVIDNFVVEIGDPPSGDVGYARWDDPLCIRVQNIPEDAAQHIIDRVAAVALALGVRPRGPGCSANVTIVFANHGAEQAAYLVETQPRMFRPFAGALGTTQGLAALDEFATSDAAVRWWQVTMPVDQIGQPAVALPQNNSPAFVNAANSLIASPIHDEFRAAYVIVDVHKLGGANWDQLADYIAMVTMVQIKPDADPSGYDSILGLFSAASAPDGLTDWDWSYLRAIYDMDQQILPDAQRSQIVSLMQRDPDGAEE